MTTDVLRLRLLLVFFAGRINRHQQELIEYLVEENRVLRERVKGHRLRLTDDERRRLAAKGHRLGRRLLGRIATIVTPDTILRWHRRLIAEKWTYARKDPGRPTTMKKIARLIVRMATENPTWGYSRIQGALKNLDHRVARNTIARVLKEQGIPPVPGRPMSWRTFLRANWGKIAAADFFTTEVWTARGLVTYYTLFVLDLSTRRVHACGLQNAEPARQRWYQQSAFYLEPIAHAERMCGRTGFVDDERDGAHTPVAVWTLRSSSSSHAPGEVSRLTSVPFVVTSSAAGVCACSVPADVAAVIRIRNGSQVRRLARFIPTSLSRISHSALR